MVLNNSKPHVLVLMMISFFLISCDSSQQSNDIESILANTRSYGTVPAFTGMTDQQVEMSRKDLQGRLWLVSFFFASCGDICPRLNAVKSKIITHHPSDSLRFLSVTVDPENDTPAFLQKHRQEMKFSDKRWSFIRMNNDSILKNFMDGLLIGYAENPENHTARIILIDSKSRIRGYFDALDPQQVDSLESILRKLK